jgi:hypothetical protein
MATVMLVLGEATFAVARQPLKRPAACLGVGLGRRVQSRIPLGHFRSFVEAVKGNDIQITNENISYLSQICEEFEFWSLSSKLSAFRDSPSFENKADPEARSRISPLEESDSQQERCLAALEAKQSRLAPVSAELSQMQTDFLRRCARASCSGASDAFT